MPTRPTMAARRQRYVVAAYAHDDHDHQPTSSTSVTADPWLRGDFVFGAQALVVAVPLLRNLEVFAVAADLVAEHGDLDAVGGVVRLKSRSFQVKVRSMRWGRRYVGCLRRNRAQRDRGATRVRRKSSARARACSAVAAGRAALRQSRGRSRQFAARRDLDAELFLLQRAEPAIGPAPEAHAGAHDLVGAFQAELRVRGRSWPSSS